MYLTFYFSAKAQVLLPAVGAVSTRSQALRQWAVLGSFWTTAAGIWIMVTRVQDYWHSVVAVTLVYMYGTTQPLDRHIRNDMATQ